MRWELESIPAPGIAFIYSTMLQFVYPYQHTRISGGREKQWAKVIAKAWLDESFKEDLMADPTRVLKEHGIEFPPGLTINLLEGKPGVLNVTLPPRPEHTTGTVDELEDRLNANPPYWPYYRA